MADLSAYADSVFRADGYVPRLYLSDMSGIAVLVGAVTVTQTDGDMLITYTTSSGSSASVHPGMRVVVRTSGGDYKGTLSVSYSGAAITSTSLPVREYSSGETQVNSGDVITVYEDLVITDKLVAEYSETTDDFPPDNQAFSNQTSVWRPLVCSGGGRPLKLDDSGNADFYGRGAGSITIDPDSGATVTHLWSGTGSPSFVLGTGSTDENPILRWTAAGKYTVTHTVTDTTNSTTSTHYLRVRIHDDADPPMDITLETLSGDAQTGFAFTVNVFENTAFANLLDNLPVTLWSADTIAGGVALGSNTLGRSVIVASGCLRRDTSYPAQSPNTVRFEVVSTVARLAELPGFSKVMLSVASPVNWNEYHPVSVKLAQIGLLRFYTNALDQFDLVYDSTFVDGAVPRIYLDKQTPYEQVMELAKARAMRFVADRSGRMMMQGELWAIPLADRAAVTTTFTFTTDDVVAGSMKLERNEVRPLETFRLRGIGTGDTDPDVATLFFRFPATPARGKDTVIQEKCILYSFEDGRTLCSLWGAWIDEVYFDVNGLQYVAPTLTVTFPLVYARMFQFYREYFGFNFSAVDSGGREIALSVFKWLFVSITEDYRALTCEVTFRAATAAPLTASVDDTPKTEVIVPPPVIVPPVIVIPPNSTLYGNIGTIAALDDAGNLLITTNFNAAVPTWVKYTPAWSGTPVMWVGNAFSAKYINGTGAVDAMVATTTHKHKLSDVFGARTVGAGSAFRFTTSYRSPQTERGVNGWVAINSHQLGGNNDIDTTITFGGSWTNNANKFFSWTGGVGDSRDFGIHVSPYVFGRLIAAGYDSDNVHVTLYQSTDNGVNWTPYNGFNFIGAPPGELHVPYQRPNADLVWHGGLISGGANPRVFKETPGSPGTQTVIDVSYGGSSYTANYQFSLITCDVDQNSVLLAGFNLSGSHSGLWLARDGLTFVNVIPPVSPGIITGCNFSGNNPNTYFAWGNATILMTINGGASFQDKSGNLAALGATRILSIIGG